MGRILDRLGVGIDDIVDFCRQNGIVEFGVFGSIVRGDWDPASDVDVLVRYASNTERSLGDHVDIVDGLSALFHREVDVLDRDSVEAMENYLRRRAILAGLRNLYAA
jgi:predicted nucleotidyltransferase